MIMNVLERSATARLSVNCNKTILIYCVPDPAFINGLRTTQCPAFINGLRTTQCC